MSSKESGIILVRSRISSPLLTPETFKKWYEEVHIPDVLATGKVRFALRYRAVDEEGAAGGLPFLAIYHLDDMSWLHEDDCTFWKIPLHSDILPEGAATIFDVAQFDTAFYTTFGYIEAGAFHAGAADISVTAPGDLLRLQPLDWDRDTDADGLAEKLACVDANRRASAPARSVLYHVDKSRPHPPSFPPKATVPGERKILTIHEMFGGNGFAKAVSDDDKESAAVVEYKLLSARPIRWDTTKKNPSTVSPS
ncbi:hypothetical protein QBC35DRAFT_488062 [Podospora australis]|uniref:Uncharacterized protein n=1 Tax=Podospora australis TaxID=1536484 RepID=A0AAN6WZ23_9PEZI|nr:hypothetical protein QBC35DRAFT_488062 [Podospora australis]